MKKIIVLISFAIVMFLIPKMNIEAYATGSGNYGTNMDGYEIIHTRSHYTKGNRIPVWIGGTDKYEYYTYYLYTKFRINSASLSENSFPKLSGNKLVGSFAYVLDMREEFRKRTGIGFEIVEGASINFALENYQSWGYTYTQGEEIEFNITNPKDSYYSIGLISIEVKIVERYVLEEVKYGGFTGNKETGRTRHAPVTSEYYYTYDYDLLPVCYSDLSISDQSKYKLAGDRYALTTVGSTFVPNFGQKYYDLLPTEYKDSFYVK